MPVRTETLAFPSAVGAGAYTVGGSGGQVIHVNTLVWDAPLVNIGGVLYGGLRDAIQTTGARTIVFDVSGEIDATSESGYSFIIDGSQFSNLTIAGQTAPEGGISIRTSEFRFRQADNVITRYLTFRRTDQVFSGYSQDCFSIGSGDNLIFDHCTFSHGNDEGVDIGGGTDITNNVTVQNCFIQNNKTGLLLGGGVGTQNYSFINNVITNTSHRFPNYYNPNNSQVDILNNVVYNFKERLIRLGDSGAFDSKVNILNNYYKGASDGIHRTGWFTGSLPNSRLFRIQFNQTSGDTPEIFCGGNWISRTREVTQATDHDLWAHFYSPDVADIDKTITTEPIFVSQAHPYLGETPTLKTAEEAYNELVVNGDTGNYKTLNADGTWSIDRDTMDSQRLNEIVNDSWTSFSSGFSYQARGDIGYPTIPNNTRPVGFYVTNPHIPEVWGQANIPEFSATSHNELAPNGYTWIENYLNLVDEYEVVNSPIITRTDSNPTTIEIGGVYTPPTGTWTDVEDGSGVATLGGDVVDVNTAGVYNVTLFHTDTDMNTGTLVIPIVVVDPNEGNQYFELTKRQFLDSQIAKKHLIKTL